MTTANGYAAMAPGAELAPYSWELGPLGAAEVRVDITHCGVCFSDIDMVDNAFGRSTYPAVPGHEIVGVVTGVGPAVQHLEVGQRVGVGPQRSGCLDCRSCRQGFEQLCVNGTATVGAGYHGGFADTIQLDAAFAFPIPEALPSDMAAPLLCAGLTVYNALQTHVRSGMRVGVLGVGGLGHVAVQFASKMGNEVVALALRPTAEDVTGHRALGADEVVDTADEQQVRGLRTTLDVIVSTAHGRVDLDPFLLALRPNGKLCLIGNTPGAFSALGRLVLGQRSVVGVASGSRAQMDDMLAFAARHGVRAVGETMPMGKVNEAIRRVRSNDTRYRLVLERD